MNISTVALRTHKIYTRSYIKFSYLQIKIFMRAVISDDFLNFTNVSLYPDANE
jgi:hypothetical protein